MNFLILDALDIHDDAPVIEEERVAGGHVLDQFGIIEANPPAIAQGALGIENELLAGFQQHLATGKLADTNLRALQVGHHADRAAVRLHGLLQQGDAPLVVVDGAVRKIQPHDIDTGEDQPVDCVLVR